MQLPSPEIHLEEEELDNFTTIEEFLNDFMDVKQRGNCGGYKCFFHSKRNPNKGYLLMQNKEDPEWCDKRDLTMIHQGWEWSVHLQRDYGLHHLLVQPPFRVQAKNQTTVTRLNEIISQFGFTTFEGTKHTDHFRLPNSPNIGQSTWNEFYVQPVIKSSPNSIMFKCVKSGNHWTQGLEKRQRLVQEVLANIQQHQTLTLPTFTERMRHGTAAVIKAAIEHRWLFRDFQFFIEPSGSIRSLDLDRCCKCQLQPRYENHTLDPRTFQPGDPLPLEDEKRRKRIERKLREMKNCVNTTWTFIKETIDMVERGLDDKSSNV